MSEYLVNETLFSLYQRAPRRNIGDSDKFVIFSDLHMGNGSSLDDFLWNSELFSKILKDYYLPQDYTLILNGDIEELQKFSLLQVKGRWKDLYQIFSLFHRNSGFIKLLGNHDAELSLESRGEGGGRGTGDEIAEGLSKNDGGKRGTEEIHIEIGESICLQYKENDILIFHGHQASMYIQRFNKLNGWLLHNIVRPLRIRNYSVSHDSRKQYKIERRVYDFSRRNKIISIIGHTHRPLFESLSKIDALKYRIEHSLRQYAVSRGDKKDRIAEEIRGYKEELSSIYKGHREYGLRSGLYNLEIMVPSLFNSGCVIGKRGITGIEIAGGMISLIHWFDSTRSSKYFNYDGLNPEQLEDTNYYRMPLKEDYLEYIFSRIELLT